MASQALGPARMYQGPCIGRSPIVWNLDKRDHYNSHDQLRDHLAAFLEADNFARRLKTQPGLTPYEATCRAWADDPSRFRYDPTHLTAGLNS